MRRTALTTDPELGGGGRPGVVYATAAAGQASRRNLTLEADNAFWAWACVEVFRHTGVRIEEMLEITHRSFVSYTLPTTGEVGGQTHNYGFRFHLTVEGSVPMDTRITNLPAV